MKLKRWLAMTVLSLFTGFGTVQAQGGLDIKVVVKGLAAEEDCELSVIEGDRSKTISQTKSEEGQINFSSKKAPAGFYYCRLPGKKYFQFLIDKDRKFEIYTSLSRPLKDLRFENSDENEAFQAFLLIWIRLTVREPWCKLN